MPKYLETGKKPYLCTAFEQILGYGVMVTLQILVLPFLVRVRVAQQKERDASAPLFLFHHLAVDAEVFGHVAFVGEGTGVFGVGFYQGGIFGVGFYSFSDFGGYVVGLKILQDEGVTGADLFQ